MDGHTAQSLAAWIGSSRESWSHNGANMSLDLELAGVHPSVIKVSRLGHETVIVRWTDRMGAAQDRRWNLPRFSDVHAEFGNGLLKLRVDLQPTPPPPKEVEVPLRTVGTLTLCGYGNPRCCFEGRHMGCCSD